MAWGLDSRFRGNDGREAGIGGWSDGVWGEGVPRSAPLWIPASAGMTREGAGMGGCVDGAWGGSAPLRAPLDSCLRRNDGRGREWAVAATVFGEGSPFPGLRSGGLPRPWIPAFAGMEAEELGDGHCNWGNGCPAPPPLWIAACAGMTRGWAREGNGVGRNGVPAFAGTTMGNWTEPRWAIATLGARRWLCPGWSWGGLPGCW